MLFRMLTVIFSTVFLLPAIAYSDALQGRVIAITDGDTVKVLDASNTQWKIRLLGIDAPEKKQAFGQKSKEHLSDLIFDKAVTVEYSKKDKYGRTVGKILIEGVDANLEQVKSGLAWHYKKYEKEQSVDDRDLYAKAEEQARLEKSGLWVDTEPTPPWEWRKTRGNESMKVEIMDLSTTKLKE